MSQEFHFEHHRLEARRNLKRFQLSLAALIMGAVGFSMPALISRAYGPSNYFMGVKILDSGDGQWGGSTSGAFGAAEVTVRRVSDGYTEKSIDNPFTFPALPASSVDGGDDYIVTVEAAPGYTVKGSTWCMDACTGYDPQTTNFRAGASASFNLISTHDYDIRWIFQPASTPAPAPAPTRISTPAPAIKTPPPPPPAATPRPAVSQAAHAPAAGGSKAAPAAVPAAEDTVPTVPGDVMATVTGENAIITLQWKASSAGTGIQGYRIERSEDNKSWVTLSDLVPELKFTDKTPAFAVHYMFRISAVSQSGKVSDYAVVDATTGSFKATSVTTETGKFTSDDKLATADVPAGALASEANCSVITMPAKVGSSKLTVIAGSYSLVCKDATGKVLKDFTLPIKWSVNLRRVLAGATNPEAAVVDNNGAAASIPGAQYDPKTRTIQFNQTSSSTVAVLGEVKHGFPWGWLIFLTVLLLGAAAFVVLLRKHQIEKYRDYLMAKYYNL